MPFGAGSADALGVGESLLASAPVLEVVVVELVAPELSSVDEPWVEVVKVVGVVETIDGVTVSVSVVYSVATLVVAFAFDDVPVNTIWNDLAVS